MDGDAFALIQNDHVCLCTSNQHDSIIESYLKAFFNAAKARHDATKFTLVKVADVNKLALLQREGVKEINLKFGFYAASLHYHARQSRPDGLINAIQGRFKELMSPDRPAPSDALRGVLTITTDERRNGLSVGQSQINELATDLITDQQPGDEFSILTNTNKRIGPNEILLRSTVSMECHGKSVDKADAWAKLVDFFNPLHQNGTLEA
jgi:hypothetical protein